MARVRPDVAAQEVREEAWHGRGFPVDPVTIANRLGISVRESELPDEVSGAIFKKKGSDAVILVDSRDSLNRKRFTIAHELGHYIDRANAGEADDFEFFDLRSGRSSEGNDEAEVFANQFAAALLMPDEAVRAAYKEHNQVVSVVAHHFGVSTDAMTYRLKNLRVLRG